MAQLWIPVALLAIGSLGGLAFKDPRTFAAVSKLLWGTMMLAAVLLFTWSIAIIQAKLAIQAKLTEFVAVGNLAQHKLELSGVADAIESALNSISPNLFLLMGVCFAFSIYLGLLHWIVELRKRHAAEDNQT